MPLADLLRSSWVEHLLSSRRGGATTRDYVYASGRRDCVRAMALDLLHPEDAPEWTPGQLERFRRGDEREAAIVSRLMQVGPRANPPFRVIEGQRRFEIKDRDGALLIVGKIDGRLQFEGRSEKPIFEVKSGESYRRVEEFADLQRSPWTRKAGDQLLAYLLAEGEPIGLLIIDRPDVPAFIEVRLEDNLERAEGFLRDARTAVDVRFGKAPLPTFIDNPSVCRTCDHCGKSCAPPLDYGEGLEFCSDPELVKAAEDRKKLAEFARQYDHADDTLKKALRGRPQVAVGPYVVTGKWQASTAYNIPKEVKRQYAEVNQQGRWITDFSLIEGETEAPE